MLNLLVKPLLGVVADGVKGFVETKKAKAELKVTFNTTIRGIYQRWTGSFRGDESLSPGDLNYEKKNHVTKHSGKNFLPVPCILSPSLLIILIE